MYSQTKRKNKIAIIVPILILLLASPTISYAKSSSDEKVCLAQVIYQEARGEAKDGKLAVAKIVLNRKNHRKFPKTICRVVNQINYAGAKKYCQFSWVCSKQRIDTSSDSWEDSLSLSHAIISNKVSLPKFGPDVLFFRSTSSRQSFGKGYRLVSVLGHAKFYEKHFSS